MSERIALDDEAATLRLGAALAPGIAPGRVIFLRGELGAGKTTLVRGLLRALGYPGRVKSPTYALVELYTVSRLDLYHFDFYRLKDPSEWLESGFRDAFNPRTACIVEWPERANGSIAQPDLDITLAHRDDSRCATLLARSPAAHAWLRDALARFCSH